MAASHSVLVHRGVVAVMSIAFCVATKADAQPVTDTTVTQASDEATTKIARLETRIQTLEARIRELEQQCPDFKRKAAKTSNGRSANASNNRVTAECNPPFVLDAEGMRHVRKECLQTPTSKSCDDPFVLDASGIKRVKTACLGQ